MGLLYLAEREVQEQASAGKLKPAAVAGPVPQPPPSVTGALKRLADFVPTETIVLFWLAVPASAALWEKMQGAPPTSATCYDWIMGISLWVFTPVLLVLAYLSELANSGKSWPGWPSLPWWKAGASVIAFPFWALAVPGNPFFREPACIMVMWVVATLVSIVLGFLDPIIMKWVLK